MTTQEYKKEIFNEYSSTKVYKSAKKYIKSLEKQLKAKDEEIERLKAESKQAYIEGSKSCDDLIRFYITKIASLEEKLKVSNDSAIK